MTKRDRHGLGDGAWGRSASWVGDGAWGASAS